MIISYVPQWVLAQASVLLFQTYTLKIIIHQAALVCLNFHNSICVFTKVTKKCIVFYVEMEIFSTLLGTLAGLTIKLIWQIDKRNKQTKKTKFNNNVSPIHMGETQENWVIPEKG